MCGIFGIAAASVADLDRSVLSDLIAYLFERSELRGMEASGIAFNVNSSISYFKSADRSSRMIRSKAYHKFYTGVLNAAYSASNGSAAEEGRLACIGHSRLVTNGMSVLDRNNQPIETGHILGVHNAIIVNDEDIFRKNPISSGLPRSTPKPCSSSSTSIKPRVDRRPGRCKPPFVRSRGRRQSLISAPMVDAWCLRRTRDRSITFTTSDGSCCCSPPKLTPSKRGSCLSF